MTATLFVTGAGISASAGIGTYRGSGASSSWTDSDLEKKSHSHSYGNHLSELWNKHWGPLSKAIQEADATPAHRAIAEYAKHHETVVATQNIDDLHEKAGSENVVHVHGHMRAVCMRCRGDNVDAWSNDGAPSCLDCRSKKTRPGVVLFGERLNRKQFKKLEQFAATSERIVLVGSSLWVHPICDLVATYIRKPNTTSIIVNKGHAEYRDLFTESYDNEADDTLPRLLEEMSA